MSNDELAALYREMAFANRHNFDRMIELEWFSRLTAALTTFADEAREGGKRLERLTWTLVALTVVIVALTVVLVVDAI